MRRAARIGALVAAVSGLAAVALWLRAPAPPAPVERLHFEPGALHGYRLSLETDVRMRVGTGAQVGETRRMAQAIEGTLHMRVFEVGREDVRLGFQLSPVRYAVGGQRDAQLEARLSTPFVARFSLRGEPLAFVLPAGLPDTEAVLLEEVVRAFQVTLGDRGAASWEVVESNAMGSYRARYRREIDGALLKQKTSYTRLAPGLGLPGRAPDVALEHSHGEFVLDARAWLRTAAVEESLHVQTQGLESWTALRGRLELVDEDGDDDVALFRGRDARAVQLAADDALRPKSPETAAEPAEHASAQALDDLLSSWRQDEPSRVARLKGLLAALAADEGLVSAIEARLREGDATSDETAMLIHALERHGTPGAQQALVSLMEDRELDPADRLRAVVALGGVERATDHALDALLDVSRDRGEGGFDTDLANTALLSLGSVAYGLRELDPQRAERVAETLETSLHQAGSANETGMALKALANTNDPERARVVEPYLDAPSEFVRSSAARALGQLQGAGASDALSRRLAAEPSARVRVGLASGLAQLEQRSPRSVAIVAQHVRSEPQAEARQQMARYLGGHLDAGDDASHHAERALKALAIGDASAAVRRDAAAMLYAQESKAREAATAAR